MHVEHQTVVILNILAQDILQVTKYKNKRWSDILLWRQLLQWCMYLHQQRVNPKKTGGGGLKGPPLDISRDYSATRKALAATLYDFFLSSFPHILTPNLWRPGVRFWSYVTFLYMHVGPKMAPKCDFVYKINANWVFSHSSYKYAYFYSQWLKLICFSIIVLQKVSATNFTEKNNKNKRSKNKEIHKKFIKQ